MATCRLHAQGTPSVRGSRTPGLFTQRIRMAGGLQNELMNPVGELGCLLGT
jgi:hypothetical protein